MYSFDSHIRYSECDANGNLSILGLVNYLQDCSTFHSETLGIGLEHSRANHYAWLLSAWQIQIERRPRFTDPITVSTWCPALNRTMAERNFSITAPDGTPYVKADSIWFVYDPEAQGPIRVPQSQQVYLTDDPRIALPKTKRRIHVEGPFVEAKPVTVTEQHLDTNFHMNNAYYIQIALDALHQVEGIETLPHRILVQYKTMALLGDTMTPHVHHDPKDDDARVVDLVNGSGEANAVVRFEGLAGPEADR